VIYLFSTTCRWCEQNWANVMALRTSRGDRFRFIAVAAEAISGEFVQARQLDLELVGGLTKESMDELGPGPTPHTLVVSRDGVVSHEWLGAFTGRTQRQIEALFGVSLPGLRDVPMRRN
jgi:hypothetical protein